MSQTKLKPEKYRRRAVATARSRSFSPNPANQPSDSGASTAKPAVATALSVCAETTKYYCHDSNEMYARNDMFSMTLGGRHRLRFLR